MTYKKQTAVEYLLYELSEIIGLIETNAMQDLLMMAAIKEAKAMEKEQGKELYFEATKYACSCYDSPTKEDFEEDYNEIYGK
jgi:hypothetical protein